MLRQHRQVDLLKPYPVNSVQECGTEIVDQGLVSIPVLIWFILSVPKESKFRRVLVLILSHSVRRIPIAVLLYKLK